jgi:osmotically-inducible protein OsmY
MNTHVSKPRLIALCLSLAAVLGAGTASAQYRDDRFREPQSNSQQSDDDRYGDHDHNRNGSGDHYVQRRVEVALNRTLGRAAHGIDVRVNGGNVYLSGYVREPRDRDAARNVASSVRGVREVYARRLRVGHY